MLGICLPECLPLCCFEGGRGWACGCLGRAIPAKDTRPAPLCLVTDSLLHVHSLPDLQSQHETSLSLDGEDPGSLAWKVEWLGNGHGRRQTRKWCEFRLGLRETKLHPEGLHPGLCGSVLG